MLVAEVLIHHLDTLRMLLGPLRVTAAQLSRSSEQVAYRSFPPGASSRAACVRSSN